MKNFILCWGVIGACAGLAFSSLAAESSAPAPDLLARLHSLGFEQLAASSNATTLREIWNLPASVELKNQTSEKLSQALAGLLSPRPKSDPAECRRLIRPLLNDLWQAESFVEMTSPPGRAPELVWALRLSEERLRVWKANFGRLVSGWDVRSETGAKRFSFGEARSWFVFSVQPGSSDQSGNVATNTSVFRRIQTQGRPVSEAKDYWLKSELNLARLDYWWSGSNSGELPFLEMSLAGNGSNLRTQARLAFSKPMNWKPEPWQIPTHTIRDPQNSLISFTAAQGLAPWLSRQPFWRELDLQPSPNQFYAWGQANVPFQVQFAFPSGNSTNWLKRIANQWVPRLNTNLNEHAVGEIRALTNRAEIVWRGLPMIVPYLRPAPEPGREFLWGGIFPMDLPTTPPPTALLAQLTGRTNLLYYDWEITEGRLGQLRALAQLLSFVTTFPAFNTNAVSQKWLDAVQPRLGNAITEIAVLSPRELSVVRNSHIGLNGLELLALAYWLDGPNFPKANFQLGFRPLPKRLEDKRKTQDANAEARH